MSDEERKRLEKFAASLQSGSDTYIVHYRCTNCGATFAKHREKGLLAEALPCCPNCETRGSTYKVLKWESNNDNHDPRGRRNE